MAPNEACAASEKLPKIRHDCAFHTSHVRNQRMFANHFSEFASKPGHGTNWRAKHHQIRLARDGGEVGGGKVGHTLAPDFSPRLVAPCPNRNKSFCPFL